MSVAVEANLRVPSLTIVDENGKTAINNQAVRFRKMIEVPAIPKPDETLELSTSGGVVLACTVTRSDWEEDRQIFVVSCKYSGARIHQDAFRALLNDTAWTRAELPT